MMSSNDNLASLFFSELKQYNSTNFRTLKDADITIENAITYKAFSSVVTRFFIFVEKHPELSITDIRMLYFKLKIDMIGRYFSQYPVADYEDLRPFQVELQQYVKAHQASEVTIDE